MPLELWLAYVATSAVVLAIPGPTILLVLSYSIAHGRQATLPLVAGVALGDSVAITLSLIGLGGVYLISLGYLLLRSAGRALPLKDQDTSESSPRKLFANAFIVTALNPKSIVFFIALLPQFISPAHALAPQLWILGTSFVALAPFGATSYALFASTIRRWLASGRAQQAYGYAGGGFLCAAGVWALTAKRVISAA